MAVIARIRAYMEEHRMTEPGDKVIVGISGGADSVCLLFALCALREELSLSLQAVHVHHGLRGEEADEDEAFVRELCRGQGVPLVCRTYPVREIAEREKLSLEEAGRKCRYQAFEEILLERGAAKIAVAHHKNDQAETMLFHLFRGTGLRGLCGIQPVRGRIIRPLLGVERREIEAWLRERGISWRTDSTNLEENYTRNKIRRQILACAERDINERAVSHMADTARELSEIEAYLEEETEKLYRLRVREEEEGCFLLTEGGESTRGVIFRRVLRRCMERTGQGLKDVERTHVRLLEELSEKEAGKRLDLPGGISAVREYGGIRIRKKSVRPEDGAGESRELSVRPKIPGTCRIGGVEWAFAVEKPENLEIIPQKMYTKWFDYDRIEKCLEIRSRRAGDYLEINGEHGRKKLKAYLIDEKIPREERETLTLLADGSHIVWIPGHRISERYKVTESTKRILKAEIHGGEENG